jgi:hypothetical protein
MKMNEVISPKLQKYKQVNGQLSPVGASSPEQKDSAKEKVELLAKKK